VPYIKTQQLLKSDSHQKIAFQI